MGKSTQGVFGNWSGKVGNVVGAVRQGRTVMRIYQPNVANPRTQRQLEARLRFSVLTRILSYVTSTLRVGFRDLDGYRTGNPFSSSVGYNYKRNPFTGTYPDITVDYSKLTLSQGGLSLPYSPAGTADSNTNSINITWSDNSGIGNAKSTDGICACAINPTMEDAIEMFDLAKRSDRTASFTIPTAWGTNEFHVFIYFRSDDGSVVSDSYFVGTYSIS